MRRNAFAVATKNVPKVTHCIVCPNSGHGSQATPPMHQCIHVVRDATIFAHSACTVPIPPPYLPLFLVLVRFLE
ncbi:hypothetical protein Cenrod_0937 [Candidatus Symbiobacter mobilis CR]|uniref:Uncharacterized protein n=1 Tax=Candidatus Symbiobacter mobilis CR TaxID=946483 RepID=U5N6X5_9BURK|nr:hypothetical protein Cenrod_0937 [Candidatus Symbiobacter mobilis CR]